MNDLPIELIYLIFKNIKIHDLWCIVRLLSKKYKSLVISYLQFKKIEVKTNLNYYNNLEANQLYYHLKIINLKQILDLRSNLYLTNLDLSNNNITEINNLPPNLTNLNLSNNDIIKIENLPPNLTTLRLSWNRITKIENLSPNLTTLNLSYNKITKIENLPPNLVVLIISNNQITKVENLPPTITNLYLSYNPII